MLVVGLTGGIGSGKTAASDAFAKLGAAIVDTDVIARELTAPGNPALTEIVARFGPDSLTDEGVLNRRALRERIFVDSAARGDLEKILHPRIDCEVRAQIVACRAAYAIIAIPLLVETGATRDYLDRILVIDVSEDVQLARVTARDHVTPVQAQQVIAAQASRQQRLDAADDIIRNDATLADLDKAVMDLHQTYLKISQNMR